MGTYIGCIAKNRGDIEKINSLWNEMNPGFEDTFHLQTEKETQEDVDEIHRDPEQKHLRYIKTVEDFDKTFPVWGTGAFQVKITLGDYLCSEMARRYLAFFDAYGDYFIENPMDDDYVKGICEEMSQEEHKAENCLVECPYCRG